MKIVDDKYTTLKDDIERVQKKSTMYISYTGNEGVEQLAHEMTNNMDDEHKNENSISSGEMSITHIQSENMTYFKDNGRGIPFEELENACTVLHSGAKMDREHGDTAGENGVGLTVTNALSSLFEVTSTRNGKARFLQFRDGRKVEDRIIDVKDKKAHGLLVAFQPSPYFMGIGATLPIESFDRWLLKKSFFMDPKIKLHFKVEDVLGKNISIDKVYQNKTGIAGYLPALEPESNLLKNAITLRNHMELMEDNIPIFVDNPDGSKKVEMTSMSRSIKIEFAFNFNPKNQEYISHSYCNDIENIQDGEHEHAVRIAITSFFMKALEATAKKNDKTEYTVNDVLAGLTVVLNMNTDMSTKFESQTKHKLGNKAFYNPVKKLCTTALTEYFSASDKKKELTTILEYIKFNAKLRLETTNKRKAVKTSTPSFMDSKCIVGYTPANNINKKDPTGLELYIGEGESAGGQLRAARVNNDIQGILCLRGKPPKVYDLTPSELAAKKSNMWVSFFDTILRCGFGSHYNEDALIYDKIIINSDADVDGDHIAGLILSAIYKHAPELITNGHVYRGVTPLYKLAPQKKTTAKGIDRTNFAYDKSELFDMFEKNVAKRILLKFELESDFVSQSNLKRFLSTNRDYYQVLDTMSDQYFLHPDIIEYMAMHPTTFKKTISELSPELKYSKDDDCVSGIYDGQFSHIILNKVFLSKMEYLTNVYRVGNESVGSYHMYEKGATTKSQPEYLGYKTIGQIMAICQKYMPDILSRYKGLGELSALEMRELAMNPANRKLLQFTVSDVERTIETLDVLFLEKNRTIRKELVQNSNVSLDDIDN